MVAIDTFLRGCDLVALKVEQVAFANGTVREQFTVTQKKTRRKKPRTMWQRWFSPGETELTTGKAVRVALSPQTRFVIEYWIAQSGKKSGDFLFTRFKGMEGQQPHITTDTFRKLVKQWVSAIGLDGADYSGHSLRSSRIDPLLEACGYANRIGQRLLVHSDTRSIDHYRKQKEVSEALELSVSINFFHDIKVMKSLQKGKRK
jgi:integrase